MFGWLIERARAAAAWVRLVNAAIDQALADQEELGCLSNDEIDRRL